MALTIDLTEDDDAEVDGLAERLARTSLGASVSTGSQDAPQPAARPHGSLQAMLELAALAVSPVAGDGNCAYHAACACLSEPHLQNFALWPVEQGGRSPSDMRLQRELRRRCVDWLQLEQHSEHRVVGTSERNSFQWDEERQKHVPPPPPPASTMDAHRRDGKYAQTPQLKAMAEVLRCVIVSIDSSRLYDRVPVFTCAQPQTLKLKSWRAEVAPVLSRKQSLSREASVPTIVIVNNGRSDAGGHFDATTSRSV